MVGSVVQGPQVVGVVVGVVMGVVMGVVVGVVMGVVVVVNKGLGRPQYVAFEMHKTIPFSDRQLA